MKVGLIGVGAVGSSLLYFAEKKGESISVFGKGDRKDRLEKGLKIKGKVLLPKTISDLKGLDILFIAVKSTAFDSVLEELRNSLENHTLLVSLLNGVSTEEVLKKEFSNPIVHSVVRGSFIRGDQGVYFEEDKVKISLGVYDGNEDSVNQVQGFLEEINYPVFLEEDILLNMWSKFCINVSENLIGAMMDINYGQMKNPHILDGIKMVQEEVVAVANAMGIPLSEKDIKSNLEALKEEIDEGVPSTLQDIRAGRKTEVDLFAGEMVRKGEEYGIATPYSKFLLTLIRGIEKKGWLL